LQKPADTAPIIREAMTRTTGNCENLISCFSINFYVSRAQRVFSASGHTQENAKTRRIYG